MIECSHSPDVLVMGVRVLAEYCIFNSLAYIRTICMTAFGIRRFVFLVDAMDIQAMDLTTIEVRISPEFF